MSTPIAALGSQPGGSPPPSLTAEDEAMIKNILHEVESEVSHASVRKEGGYVAPGPMQQQQQMQLAMNGMPPNMNMGMRQQGMGMMPQNMGMMYGSTSGGIFNAKRAQYAVMCAIIAGVLFYPKTLALLYEKVPVLESYDIFIRCILLAIVLYVLFMKLENF